MNIGEFNEGDHVAERMASKTTAQFEKWCCICRTKVPEFGQEVFFQVSLVNRDAGIHHSVALDICKRCAQVIHAAVAAW
jgi:hypothetical protein